MLIKTLLVLLAGSEALELNKIHKNKQPKEPKEPSKADRITEGDLIWLQKNNWAIGEWEMPIDESTNRTFTVNKDGTW